MVKGLDALERLYCAGDLHLDYVCSDRHKEDYGIIEKELKQAKENEEMLNVFKNALTIERKLINNTHAFKKDREGCISYLVSEIIEIKQNELDEKLRKSLREWVLKNAFPKELEILQIIFESPSIIEQLFKLGQLGKEAENRYFWGTITDSRVEKVKEFFADGKRDQSK